MRHILKILVIAAVASIALAACSPRKNTAASRNYQAFITRYNIYYNGDSHLQETLKDMEKKYEDEYSRRLLMHPAEAHANPKAPKPAGSFDRSIEKAQKAIQLRSIKKKPKKKSGRNRDEKYKAWMKRDEYNPFIHNAWLMMGKSQYYKGDFMGAASTFGYVAKHFTWLPKVETEAKLWQARAYCADDWLFEAETILRRIKPDTDLPDNNLRGLYYFDYADYYIRSHQYEQALPMLTEAIKYASGSQKVRLTFLKGQLCQELGKNSEAFEAYRKVSANNNASYRTKFNARIKQSEVYEGENIEPEVRSLRRMTRYERNKEYLDQIYYAIGNLYLTRRDTAQAIESYKLAIEKSTRAGFDKALAQLTLGRLYFGRGEYTLAQPCYSEAVPQLPQDYPDYQQIKRRSDVLDELAVYAGNVELQDSLLRLSEMTPEQQLAVVNKIIDELKKKEKEEAEAAAREEYMANQEANAAKLNNNSSAAAPSQFSINNSDSWYFYNTATRNQGKSEFQRRWGSRKLEDDWRRRNKNTFNTSDFQADSNSDDSDSDADSDNQDTEGTEGESTPPSTDPHNPEYYLSQIPKTDEEKQTANDIIQEGLYNMGLILKDKLEDFPAAAAEWDKLLNRYPDNTYRLDVYYNLFLMYSRLGNAPLAEMWRQKILADFPESKEGMALRDPDFVLHLKEMDARQEGMYEAQFDHYLNNRNAAVHAAYEEMRQTYPMSRLMPKFMFLHALAYVTEGRPDDFSATLKELLEKYPQTDITPLASSYLKGLAQGRQLNQTASNIRPMVWSTRLSNDSTAVSMDTDSLTLSLDPSAPQCLVLLYPTDSVPANQLIYEVARHNFNSYTVRDFDLEPMQFGSLGLLVIKGLANADEARRYRNTLIDDASLAPLMRRVRPVIISEADFKTLIEQGRSFDDYFAISGEQQLDNTHNSVLPPDEYPSRTEMYETEPAPRPETDAEAAPEPPATPTVAEPAQPAAPANTPTEPQPKPSHTPATQPVQQPKPQIPEGSEGDDPLLE